MKMKHLLGLIFVGACFSTVVVASEKELSIEEQAAQILKESDSPWSDSDEQKPVRSPAAGFGSAMAHGYTWGRFEFMDEPRYSRGVCYP